MAADAVALGWTRRSVWVLAALLVCLGAVGWYQVRRASTGAGGTASPPLDGADRGAATLGSAPPDVRLGALEGQRPDLVDSTRNPFRFQPRAPVPSAARGAVAAPQPHVPVPAAAAAGGPSGGQPPPAPILLKFIGVIESAGAGKIAALSDGRFVYHGREGEVIEGRYRIVKIGVESIVMEHIDGRGRQTIRLTG